ncbi:FG-GAP repeat domain-containing protein [Cytobacillus praedii]|uniref:FG-GAP repeat domain-containing protein n=1 Tax=Cytobacillus praedii TaxID=1742358 RepID=UPI00399D2C9E
MNGDGFIDIATANVGTSDVSILLNNRFEIFSPGKTVPLTIYSFPFDITSADINCDGIPDLATANPGTDNVSVLTNNGAAQFSVTNFPVGTLCLFNGFFVIVLLIRYNNPHRSDIQ